MRIQQLLLSLRKCTKCKEYFISMVLKFQQFWRLLKKTFEPN